MLITFSQLWSLWMLHAQPRVASWMFISLLMGNRRVASFSQTELKEQTKNQDAMSTCIVHLRSNSGKLYFYWFFGCSSSPNLPLELQEGHHDLGKFPTQNDTENSSTTNPTGELPYIANCGFPSLSNSCSCFYFNSLDLTTGKGFEEFGTKDIQHKWY